jgi:antagonist of KipI
MTIKGPRIAFETDAVIAVTGADLSPMVNQEPIPLWSARRVRREDVLGFGERRSGARAYLAVAGGIDVPVVLGSRSTHLPSRTGGFSGCALRAGDLVDARPTPDVSRFIGATVPDSARPVYSSGPTLRVVLGPQVDRFSPEAVQTLLTTPYVVTPRSDRMGYRLHGAPLVHSGSPDMVSDATPMGAVQVPADRQPILLMADRPTTGGYPKIAVVMTADLPLAAQLLPGETVRFAAVEVREAQAFAREQRIMLEAVSRTD